MVLVVCLCGAKFATVALLHTHATDKGHFFQCTLVGCGAVFKSEQGVADHQKNVKHEGPIATLALLKDYVVSDTPSNDGCLKCFACDSKRTFKHDQALAHHIRDAHQICPECNQVFESKSQRRGHQQAARHCYCEDHDLAFKIVDDFKAHMRHSVHASAFQCLDCNREFGTQRGLNDHLPSCPASNKDVTPDQSERAQAAFAAVEEANLHCEACNRTFKNITAFRQHKQSVKHKPLANLNCNVVPGKCNQIFTSYSAWFCHVESGKCKSGMTRKKLHEMVHAGDKDNLITYASSEESMHSVSAAGLCSQASITGITVSDLEDEFDRLSVSASSQHGVVLTPIDSDNFSDVDRNSRVNIAPSASDAMSDVSSTSGVLLTPSGTMSRSRCSSIGGVLLTPPLSANSQSEWSYITGSHRLTPATTSVVESSADTITYDNLNQVGQAWPCTICPRSFKNKNRLLQYLKSPAHDPKLFHCPPAASLGLNRGKQEKSFKTLSGLAQHVEAGACTGGVDLLKTFIDICQSKSKLAVGQIQNLIAGAS